MTLRIHTSTSAPSPPASAARRSRTTTLTTLTHTHTLHAPVSPQPLLAITIYFPPAQGDGPANQSRLALRLPLASSSTSALILFPGLTRALRLTPSGIAGPDGREHIKSGQGEGRVLLFFPHLSLPPSLAFLPPSPHLLARSTSPTLTSPTPPSPLPSTCPPSRSPWSAPSSPPAPSSTPRPSVAAARPPSRPSTTSTLPSCARRACLPLTRSSTSSVDILLPLPRPGSPSRPSPSRPRRRLT